MHLLFSSPESSYLLLTLLLILKGDEPVRDQEDGTLRWKKEGEMEMEPSAGTQRFLSKKLRGEDWKSDAPV